MDAAGLAEVLPGPLLLEVPLRLVALLLLQGGVGLLRRGDRGNRNRAGDRLKAELQTPSFAFVVPPSGGPRL